MYLEAVPGMRWVWPAGGQIPADEAGMIPAARYSVWAELLEDMVPRYAAVCCCVCEEVCGLTRRDDWFYCEECLGWAPP